MTSFFRKLSWLMRRRRKEAELEEELRFHLDEEAEQRQAEGLSTEQARWAARRDLGNVALLQESTRATWGWTSLEQLGQDLRYAFRTMGSNRLFTLLAVMSLALGIGANTAIYSFMDWILMRSLPVHDPDSLIVMNWRAKIPRRLGDGKVWHSMSGSIYGDSKSGLTAGIFPYPVFDLFRKSDSLFSSVFAFCPAGSLNLTTRSYSDRVRGEYVTGDYFRGLGVAPAEGRLLVADDDRAGAPAVTVMSFALSQRRFGSAEAALGQSIRINHVPFTVAGVTPPEFFGVNPADVPDLYVPMQASLLLEADPMVSAKKFLERNYYWLEMMARLRPGVAPAQAQATLALPFHQWVESTATNDEARSNLPELLLKEGAGGLDALRRQFSKPLYVLMLLVGLILAIACANIATLLLARATARRREIAIRLSVGASRLRVVRQLLTESVVLASLGGVLGVLFAIWGIRFLSLLLAGGQQNFVPRAELNWSVLGVAAALSLLTGAVFGLAPAIQATRVDVLPALKDIRANRAPSRMRVSLSHVLVVSQIAMSLLLLFAMGLFVRTLSNLQSVNVGFQRENLLLFQLNARQAGHRGPEMVRFFADLRKRLSAIPGVHNVSLSNRPLFTAGFSLRIEVSGTETQGTRLLFVGPEFFTTMKIPLLLGREINERDHLGSPEVAVVSEMFAKTNFGTENPVGRRLTMKDPDPREMEIIGVVKDARYGGVKRDLPPVVYMPYDQGALKFVDEMTYAVRTSGDPLAYANTIREIVHQADARVPVANLITQAAQIDQAIHQEIAFAKLCTLFALLALLIASVGIYGTVAYSVARRTSEIGIRIALGAQRSSVVFRVLREVFVLALVGLAISVPAALSGSKFVESFLYGMRPNDPLTVVLAAVILLGAALAAGYVPAWKASRIDPMLALRHE
ncbi:MAG TPA: ABC transporter permease [Candidatus Acidoferrales bacterium]|nr:ABC transporter permease [Candidatus Acidoferrales bacterium]